MRDIVEIFGKIVDLVPEESKVEFKNMLDWLKKTAPYTAPEIMGNLWWEVNDFLSENATKFDRNIVDKMIFIWNDKTERNLDF
ncbi:MAG: hypothetical protein WC549_09685 [Actinomycetota bacterium]